jgi:hypothetical protein
VFLSGLEVNPLIQPRARFASVHLRLPCQAKLILISSSAATCNIISYNEKIRYNIGGTNPNRYADAIRAVSLSKYNG